MLRKLRITVSALFFIGLTLLFMGIGHNWWGWMPQLQFAPAARACAQALGDNLAVVIGIIVITLLFGRIYCSVICPLGIFQDIVNWFSSRRKGHRFRFHFRKSIPVLRYGMLLIFCIACFTGIQLVVAILEPYSAYGRIIVSIVHPLRLTWALGIVAAVTLVAVTVLSWLDGRLYCNTVCPVGSFLGAISKYSLFHPVIDEDKCSGCHLCERGCKSSCIDSYNHIIDTSRCVDCFDCIGICKSGAISFAHRKAGKPQVEGPDKGRRAFITGLALIGGAATVKAQEQKLDGGLAAIEGKKVPERKGRLIPAGAVSEEHFSSLCTACQLCVTSCPNKVLRPSGDLDHIMQPEMGYENGYCRPECTVCSEVCPAGAITRISAEEKTSVSIGHAVIDYELCVAYSDKDNCGNCARHCQSDAILMVPKDPSDRNSRKIPTVLEEKCIGCGACEYLCPSRPFSAIHIEGHKTHIIHG